MSIPENVSFQSRPYKLAAHFYKPTSNFPNRSGAAIVICHPWTSIKEQSPANYARVLSEAGFICLAYDAAYQGESEGEPRSLEDPYQRVKDIECAIGVLGICALGGYAPFAAQTDMRIKAVATSAAVCVGTMARRGFDKDSTTQDVLTAQLENAAKDRNCDIEGHEHVDIVHMLPDTIEAAEFASLPPSFLDLATYYRVRQPHPRAPNTCLPRSWDIMPSFDAFAHVDMISPRPILMITGTKAATKWYSEMGVERAGESKELVAVDGLMHADLYDHVVEAGKRCVEFFGRYLK